MAEKRVYNKKNAYVISERSKLFSWVPIYYSTNQKEAVSLRRALEDNSPYGPKGYKMNVVKPIVTTSK